MISNVSTFPRATFTKPTVFLPIFAIKPAVSVFLYFLLDSAAKLKFDFRYKFRMSELCIIDFFKFSGKLIYLICEVLPLLFGKFIPHNVFHKRTAECAYF